MNALLIRNGLIDYISVVVTPLIVGGRDVSTLVDGDSIVSFDDLKLLRPLELVQSDVLSNSYLHLKYKLM